MLKIEQKQLDVMSCMWHRGCPSTSTIISRLGCCPVSMSHSRGGARLANQSELSASQHRTWSVIYILLHSNLGAVSIRKTVLPGMAIPMLRGGMAPCRVIFHENVNFLFVVQKCQVIHAFHKTHKQNVFAVIEIHTSGNFIDNMVFGDQRVSTKNEDGEQHSVNYFG